MARGVEATGTPAARRPTRCGTGTRREPFFAAGGGRGEIARRLAACERRVATRRVKRTALESVGAGDPREPIQAASNFAARCGRSPAPRRR